MTETTDIKKDRTTEIRELVEASGISADQILSIQESEDGNTVVTINTGQPKEPDLMSVLIDAHKGNTESAFVAYEAAIRSTQAPAKPWPSGRGCSGRFTGVTRPPEKPKFTKPADSAEVTYNPVPLKQRKKLLKRKLNRK